MDIDKMMAVTNMAMELLGKKIDEIIAENKKLKLKCEEQSIRRSWPHLTVNELMVLLDCHRGTLNRLVHSATINRDIQHLVELGYLEEDNGSFSVQHDGFRRVKYCQGDLS